MVYALIYAHQQENPKGHRRVVGLKKTTVNYIDHLGNFGNKSECHSLSLASLGINSYVDGSV